MGSSASAGCVQRIGPPRFNIPLLAPLIFYSPAAHFVEHWHLVHVSGLLSSQAVSWGVEIWGVEELRFGELRESHRVLSGAAARLLTRRLHTATRLYKAVQGFFVSRVAWS